MTTGMIGRKVGMMTLYDGAGIARGVTVVELGPNPVTQVRTEDRDGYQAVQVGFEGQRKRLTQPERGHLQAAGVADRPLSELHEFRVDSVEEYSLGQVITVDQFEPGSYVDVTGTSEGSRVRWRSSAAGTSRAVPRLTASPTAGAPPVRSALARRPAASGRARRWAATWVTSPRRRGTCSSWPSTRRGT